MTMITELSMGGLRTNGGRSTLTILCQSLVKPNGRCRPVETIGQLSPKALRKCAETEEILTYRTP